MAMSREEWEENNRKVKARYDRLRAASTGGADGHQVKKMDAEITARLRAAAYRAFEGGGDGRD